MVEKSLFLTIFTWGGLCFIQFKDPFYHLIFQGMTSVTYESGLGTWLVCGGICLFGLWAGCCLIPFCINDLKDANHICTNCKKLIKTKKVIS
jgi:lipopolysaccharide-induced tumor necrosis factor-alpha factor